MSTETLVRAFSLTLAGSAGCLIGGSVVFFERFVKQVDTQFLAGALALSSGVMLTVSMTEIFSESKIKFEDAGHSVGFATLFTTINFFTGFALVFLLSSLLELILGRLRLSSVTLLIDSPKANAVLLLNNDTSENDETVLKMKAVEADADAAAKRLSRLGLLASIAIVIQSVPEGLGLCVAAASGAPTGSAIAIAIAIHKLFEGVVVAVPQFYATGSRRRAFAWSALAAIANPIGGLLGIAAMARGLPSDNVFGVTYGILAGIMTWIALGELLPQARELDPNDKITSKGLAAGMAVMSATLCLLAFTGAP